MTTNFKTAFTLATLAILITACGKKDENFVVGVPAAPVDIEKQVAKAAAADEAAAAAAAKSNFDPKGDPSVAVDRYKELTEDSQVLAQYVRLAGVPDDVTPIAKIFSPAFSNERDGFKRRDFLTKYRETLVQMAKNANDGAYFWIDLTTNTIAVRPSVGGYDFEKKSFPIHNFVAVAPAPGGRDGMGRFGDRDHADGKGVQFHNSAAVRFYNWRDFQALPVADEAVARRIEDERKKYIPSKSYNGGDTPLLTLRVYGYAAAASADVGSIRAQIMKVVLVDREGTVVAKL